MNVYLAALWRSPRRLLSAVVLVGLFGVAVFWLRPHLSAWYHFRAASSALNRYHSREAIEHLRICVQTWPKDAEALLLVARMARRIGNYAEAEIALSKYEDQRGNAPCSAPRKEMWTGPVVSASTGSNRAIPTRRSSSRP
jgi:cytochrome c-type biogenesis protein CcmH/NrfG